MKKLIKGRERAPLIIVAYGVPGVGKSTFAAGAERALFLGPERNGAIDAYKMPAPRSGAELMVQLNDIATGVYNGQCDGQNFKTLVVDSIDMIAQQFETDLLRENPGKTMTTVCGGFGKGWVEVHQRLVNFKDALLRVQNATGMDVVILSHAKVNKFDDPLLGIAYDTYELPMHKSSRLDFNALFTDLADCVFFLNWRKVLNSAGDHALSVGEREILTEHRASHLAKNRFNLPFSIELKKDTYAAIYAAIDAFYNSGAIANTAANDFAILVSEIKKLMSNAKIITSGKLPEVQNYVNQAIKDNNINALKATLTRLQNLVAHN